MYTLGVLLQAVRRAERELRADMGSLQSELAAAIEERAQLRQGVAPLRKQLESALAERARLQEELDVALDERDEARAVGTYHVNACV